MTLEEKIGQLIQADIDTITPDELRKYKLGSVLAGGNDAPGGDVRTTPAHWLELADHVLPRLSGRCHSAHAAIPELFGIDAVHGHSRIPGATVFPHNVGLGRDSRSGVDREDRSSSGRRGRRHRAGLDLCAHGRGGARCALGPIVRKLFGGSGAWSRATHARWCSGLQGGRAQRLHERRAHARQRQAFSRRRRHARTAATSSTTGRTKTSCARSMRRAMRPRSRRAR